MPAATNEGAGRLVIYPSRVKTALVLLGSIAFVLIGIWIGTPGMASRVAAWERIVAMYIGAPFFACCGVYAMYRLVVRRPAVILDSTGVTDAASAVAAGLLRWEEIDRVVLYQYAGQAMLGIVPKDVERVLARQPALSRWVIRANLALGIAPINVPQAVLPMRIAELADTLEARFGVRVERDA